MVGTEAMLGSPCQGPNCLMISYLGIDMVLIFLFIKIGKIMFGSFYRPEEPLHQEVHSGSQIPALAEFDVKFDVVQQRVDHVSKDKPS